MHYLFIVILKIVAYEGTNSDAFVDAVTGRKSSGCTVATLGGVSEQGDDIGGCRVGIVGNRL